MTRAAAVQKKFIELLKLRRDLNLSEEESALVAARMVAGNGFQSLHDAIEEIHSFIDGEDLEDAESYIDGGIEILTTLWLKHESKKE